MQPLNRGGVKTFPTEALAQLWVRRHLKLREFNYFVGFRCANGYGISYSWSPWVGEGHPYVKDIFPRIVH
jgi:hypothetical protein